MKHRLWTTLLLTGVATLMLATLTASTPAAATTPELLTIRHSLSGCHFWAFTGGGAPTTQLLVLHEGQSFTLENRDNHSHELVQTGGPTAVTTANLSGTEGTMIEPLGPGVRVTLATAGLYRFKTVENHALRYGWRDDLYGGFSRLPSRGPDHALQLIVRVAPDRNHLPD